ncbi:MAG: hypothetical protein LW808_001075 [Verrucomicrobiota bacterium]|nr:MAG: hypothetical protein LW808_001075 [Verrucomicrobiota bacterium]
MIKWGFLKKLLSISCVGATVFTASGSTSRTIAPVCSKNFVIHRLKEKIVSGEKKVHKLHIRRTGDIPTRTYISIEDFNGQRVTLEGEEISFTEIRKTPENIVALHIAHNTKGLIEVSLIGDSANEITRFLHASGQKITIHVGPSGEFQKFNRDSHHGKGRVPYSKISYGDTQIGHSAQEVNDKYRAQGCYWWVLGHKFQDVSIRGYISPLYVNDQIMAYPLIEIAGMQLKKEGVTTGFFIPELIVATIDATSGLPQVEILEHKKDNEPRLTVIDCDPLYRKALSIDPKQIQP